MQVRQAQALRDMRHWLERAVIGLNLCPFAKAVHVKGQVHYAACDAAAPAEALEALGHEMDALLAEDPARRDTTLLVLTGGFADFLEFQHLEAMAQRLLRKRRLDGVLQIASFHPDFEFGDAAPDALSNFSNRAPWPTLHLLREDSVQRAVDAFPDAQAIYGANIATLERLGHEGWAALRVGRGDAPVDGEGA